MARFVRAGRTGRGCDRARVARRAGEDAFYSAMLLEELGGERTHVVSLYEATYALDLLSEMATRFNRPAPVPVDAARRARLIALLEDALAR